MKSVRECVSENVSESKGFVFERVGLERLGLGILGLMFGLRLIYVNFFGLGSVLRLRLLD
jgi:hypothetical protein